MSDSARRPSLRRIRRGGEAYQFLFAEAELGVLLLGRTIEDCSEAACHLLGRPREALVGCDPLAVSAPLQPDGVRTPEAAQRHLAEALAGRAHWCQWRFLRPDGTAVDASVHVEALLVDSRRRVLLRLRDASGQQRSQERLRESDARLQTILEHSTNAMIFGKDLEGRYLFVNSGFERRIGVRREEAVGRTAADLFPPEVAAVVRARDREVVELRRPIEYEESLVVGGETRTQLTTRFPLLDANGEPYAVCGISTDITARKRAEEAMRRAAIAVSTAQGEGVFRELVRALAEILDVDIAFIALGGSQERCRLRMLAFYMDGRLSTDFEYPLAGTPCETVLGQCYRIYPERLAALFPRDEDFVRLGAEAYAGHPLDDSEGSPLGVMSIVSRKPLAHPELVEATLKIFAARAVRELERGRAHEALQAAEASYRAIFDAGEDPIFVHDWDTGAIVDVNAKACAVYGYSRDELLRAGLDAISSGEAPYTAGEALRYVEEAKRAGAVAFEWHRRNRDGSLHWDEVRLKSAVIGGHRRILAFTREITERKLALQALRASESQYRAIFNAWADALVLRDADFRIVDVNATYEAFTGRRREEVIGIDRVIANPPGVDARVRALHGTVLAGEPIQLETRLLHVDGSSRDLELRGIPIRHQERPHVLYIGRDITARKRADAERADLEAQLRQAQKMEAIGHVTGGIAHDFNNILTSVLGYVVLAREVEKERGEARVVRYLDQAERSALRARDLIQQMLTFSRGQRGDRRPVHLPALLRESRALLESTLSSTIELALDLDGSLPPVHADPVQLEQIVLNLCINARDAMSGTGTIRIGARRAERGEGHCTSCRQRFSGMHVELSVTDTGAGIRPEVLDRMFEPFFTTKEVGRGSGMGLATVHGIVHDHGGHILVDTAPGAGTTFRVVLAPAASGSESPGGGDAAPPNARAARPRLAGRILLVEDEPTVREFMQELLQTWGLAVTALGAPRQAEAAFESDPDAVDLVLTDQTMPKLTGLELARRLTAIRPELPVILYSGFAGNLSEEQVRQCGVTAVLGKPIDPAALLHLLRTHLPRR